MENLNGWTIDSATVDTKTGEASISGNQVILTLDTAPTDTNEYTANITLTLKRAGQSDTTKIVTVRYKKA